MISIKGLDKAAVLQVLFQSSFQQGLGQINSEGEKALSLEDAEMIIESQGHVFDYLRGRVMKVDIAGDEFDPALFDRDVGLGAAQRAIESIVKLNSQSYIAG